MLPLRQNLTYYSNEEGLVDHLTSHGLGNGSMYFICEGRHVSDFELKRYLDENSDRLFAVHVSFRLRGGKGGFGSLLRSFRVNKSTNQLMCRDLNGRRVASIEEEKKLRQWIEKAAEREKEKAAKRKAKIERLRNPVSKHEFTDNEYCKVSEDILDKVDDAVEQGFEEFKKARNAKRQKKESTSDSGSDLEFEEYGGKRKKKPAESQQPKAKKARSSVDPDESSTDSEDEAEVDQETMGALLEYFQQRDGPETEDGASTSDSGVGGTTQEQDEASSSSKPAKDGEEYQFASS